jgi:hypothetical protein
VTNQLEVLPVEKELLIRNGARVIRVTRQPLRSKGGELPAGSTRSLRQNRLPLRQHSDMRTRDATADLLEKARTQAYNFDLLSKPVHPNDLLAKLRI